MDNEILKFIYVVAMRDATLQKSYEGEKKWLTNLDDFPKISEAFASFINKIIDNGFNNQNEYDEAFLELAHIICDGVNSKTKNGDFKFGNAQKLINIATKYLYIWSYNDKNKKEIFKWCHCPMDQIMIDHVWKNRKNVSGELGTRIEFHQSWGNEDFENKGFPQRYVNFQNAIKKLADKTNQNRVEYDYSIWS